jgi:hypothetical protein
MNAVDNAVEFTFVYKSDRGERKKQAAEPYLSLKKYF